VAQTGKYRNAEDAAEDLIHSRWREKVEPTYQGTDVSEAEAQRLAKAVLDTVTQISAPRMAGARWPNFGTNRQRRSKRLMGGNMSSGPKTRRRKNWTQEPPANLQN